MLTPMPDLSLVDGLVQLTFAVQDILTRMAEEHDLSLAQLRLLGILRDREPGMRELARYLDLEKSSLSGLVDRAGSRGLVERVPSAEDRRAATIRATARGRRLIRLVEAEVEAEVAKLVAPLSSSERRELAQFLAKLTPGAA